MQSLDKFQDQIITPDINFRVKKIPLTAEVNGTQAEIPSRFLTVGGDRVFDVVGRNYKPENHRQNLIQVARIVRAINSGNSPVSHTWQGSRLISSFLLSDNKYQIMGREEKALPSINLYQSFDGSRSWEIDIAVIRMICENGMIVKSDEFESIRQRHSMFSYNPDKVIDILPNMVQAYIEKYLEMYAVYKDHPVIDLEDLPKENTLFPKKIYRAVIERSEIEFSNIGKNAWAQWNAITHVLTRSSVTQNTKQMHYRIALDYFTSKIPV